MRTFIRLTLAVSLLLVALPMLATDTVTDSQVMPGSGEIALPYVAPIVAVATDSQAAAWGPLCIEPSPCTTSADCGVTKEGFPGVCLPNFDYPQVPSPKVCLCP